MKLTTTAVLAALGLASSAVASIGRGVPQDISHIPSLYQRHRDSGEYMRIVHKRGTPTEHLQRRAAPTDEASAAKISDPVAECTAYNLPEVAAIANKFPKPWENATIVSGDSEAQDVWKTIQGSGIIPTSVKPKGTANGDFSAFTPTYDKTDPDCWWTFNGCVKPKHDKLPADTYSCPEPSTWGLTFDDGPNCTHNAFYDFLLEKKQKATLFYIGSNVLDWPLEAQRGLVDGHHLCVHTWSHQYMTALPDEQVFAELYYTAKVIKDVVGVTPTCWRPPFGDVDDRVRGIATGLGLETVIWTDDTDDWQLPPAGTKSKADVDNNYKTIIGKQSASGGNIVLTHEINDATMQEFMGQYANIQAAFKHIVPLTACKNQTKPYPDMDITYPNFADYTSGKIDAKGLPSGTTIKASDADYKPQLAASYTSNGGAQATGGSAAAVTASGSIDKAKGSSSSSSSSTASKSASVAAFGTCSMVASLVIGGACAVASLFV
ncbi:uncharacterized protein PFL1_03811 [Pseudozyma flocculosa PF-1]|uniref:chitin deacetylase n=2 Tax=Pseudozyma flocculosa TaxID=84751 RepID=A0A5C3EX45_9BASI|nr:uncharacterized protein PFL1_03811 [Pseudozyma flocculosa PF-1]EPQ28508.1 hypothetical protein PFL1_03811 [Pseudozyma flocculosa PF-1]SPO36430.1 related to Chitin deacetylase precursor [Pseudozyma flocculosa]